MITQFMCQFPVIYFGMTSFLLINCENKRKLIAKPLWCLLLDISIVKVFMKTFIEIENSKEKDLKTIMNRYPLNQIVREVKKSYDEIEDSFVDLIK